MTARLKGRVTREVEVEAIPDLATDSEEWLAWCEERDIYPLNSGRRGWCDSARTYIRGADYLAYSGDEIVNVLHAEELEIVGA